MLSTIHSIAINGLSASRVLIEVNVSPVKGPREPVYIMVGLPDNAVKESKTRVRWPWKTAATASTARQISP